MCVYVYVCVCVYAYVYVCACVCVCVVCAQLFASDFAKWRRYVTGVDSTLSTKPLLSWDEIMQDIPTGTHTHTHTHIYTHTYIHT